MPAERIQEQRVLAQRLRALRASPLAGGSFVLLVSGRAISMLGSAMAPVALAFAVLRLTGSTGDLGVVLAARSVSVVVFLLLGGVISDRLPRHVVAAVLAGIGIEIFGVRWYTTMHEQVPASMQSRLFAYDALGSFFFIPVGQALAGPVQGLIGTADAIWAGTAVIAFAVLAVLFVPQVRSLRAHQAPAPSLLGAES